MVDMYKRVRIGTPFFVSRKENELSFCLVLPVAEILSLVKNDQGLHTNPASLGEISESLLPRIIILNQRKRNQDITNMMLLVIEAWWHCHIIGTIDDEFREDR